MQPHRDLDNADTALPRESPPVRPCSASIRSVQRNPCDNANPSATLPRAPCDQTTSIRSRRIERLASTDHAKGRAIRRGSRPVTGQSPSPARPGPPTTARPVTVRAARAPTNRHTWPYPRQSAHSDIACPLGPTAAPPNPNDAPCRHRPQRRTPCRLMARDIPMRGSPNHRRRRRFSQRAPARLVPSCHATDQRHLHRGSPARILVDDDAKQYPPHRFARRATSYRVHATRRVTPYPAPPLLCVAGDYRHTVQGLAAHATIHGFAPLFASRDQPKHRQSIRRNAAPRVVASRATANERSRICQ